MSLRIRQGHLGTVEATVIAAVATGGKFLYVPRIAAAAAGPAGWMLPVLNALFNFLMLFLTVNILDPDSDRGIVDEFEHQAGLLGTILLVGVVVDFVLLEGFELRRFGGEARAIILPTTPVLFIELAALLGIVYAAFLGLEALGRASMLYGVPMAGTILALLAVAFPRARLGNLLPIFGFGLKPILRYTVVGGLYREIWVLFALWPYLRKRQKILRIGVSAIGISALLMTVVVAAALSYIAIPATPRLPFPIAEIARAAQLGDYLSNLESVFTFLLTFVVLLHLSMVFWAALIILSDLLRIPGYRQLIPILALAVVTASVLPKGLAETIQFADAARVQGSIVAYPLLVLIWLVAWLKRRGRGRGKGRGEGAGGRE